MEQFRTTISAPSFSFAFSHSSRVMMLGSCFAENMGSRLLAHKIPTAANPFGILFNPFSIMNALERMLNHRLYSADELVQAGEYWVSLDHHGRFCETDRGRALAAINTALQAGCESLLNADVLFITLGSAWVYRHRKTNHIVANCHKIPAAEFAKELLPMQACHLILRHIPQFLATHGVRAQVVFTLSPVRHWKDGAIENQRSKAQLLAAIHQVVDEFPSCHYFPAYELMMDDLRDYRFYGADMLHPTPQAEDYIWEKFQQSFFTDECRVICREVAELVQAAQHRPVDPESNSFQRFARKQLELITTLEAKYPNLDLTLERERFQGFLM